jgi:hypothetical protein
MIATDLATTIVADTKDAELELTITLEDGTEFTGDPISVNSKGVNVKIDGKVRSFSLKRIAALTNADMDEDDEDGDTDTTLEDLANEVSDGATTTEVAALLSDFLGREVTPKELRVHLRALGLGVGKGNKYALSEGEFRAVIRVLTDVPANA